METGLRAAGIKFRVAACRIRVAGAALVDSCVYGVQFYLFDMINWMDRIPPYKAKKSCFIRLILSK
jgi:hypothetical protein